MGVFVFFGMVADGRQTSFYPGQPWLDTDGTHINAHGYSILKHEGKYYWYGSHKIAGKTEAQKNGSSAKFVGELWFG